MFRKIFFIALLLGVTIFTSATTMAAKNPANDPNLVKFYQHQGLENYLFGNSLRLSKEDGLTVISFKFISYDSIQPENTDWNRVEEMAFAYDESTRKVYFFDQNGNLDYLDPNGTIAEGSGYAPGAEIVYYIKTGKRFYGTYDDSFYAALGVG